MKLRPTSNPHFDKDQKKADVATKFIGVGVTGSSTDRYRIDFGDLANCGQYTEDCVVFVSANGRRKNRKSIPIDELNLAVSSSVIFVADNPAQRNNGYNIGEQELAEFLLENNYIEIPNEHCSIWAPREEDDSLHNQN